MYRMLIGSLAVLFLITAGYPASAQETVSAFYDTGVFAYEDGDYKAAEAAFRKALKLDSNSPSANHYLGKTYIKMERFKEARPLIEKAWQGDPDLTDLSFDRAFLYYKLEDYGKAAGLFQSALKEDPSSILANFYCGVSLYRNGQYEAANPYLMTTAEKSPDLTVKAYYYSGLCLYHMGKRAQAVDKLTYVSNSTTSDDVRKNAEKWLARISEDKKEKKPYEFRVMIGYGYDDNVILAPDDYALDTDEKDYVVEGEISGEYRFVDNWDFLLGAGLSRHQLWYQTLDEYNTSETEADLFGAYQLGDFVWGVNFLPAVYQLDEEDFLLTLKFKPNVSYIINKNLLVSFKYTYSNNDYRQDDYNLRDGNNHNIFLDTVYYMKNKSFISGGIGYENNTTDDEKYDYGKFFIKADGRFNIFEKIQLVVQGNYSKKTYEDKDEFEDAIEDKTRKDDRFSILAVLSRSLYFDWLELQVEYTYTKNESNFDYYTYTRHVIGAGIKATF